MLSIGGSETWKAQPDDYTATLTSAAAVTLPDTGYRLVRVMVETGTTPGSLSIRPDGVTQCHFPTGSNGTIGTAAWAVLWPVKGTNIPAALFTFNGGLTRAVLTFSKGQSKGPDIQSYRAIRFTVTTSATHSSATAFSAGTYDVAPAIPTSAMVLATTVGYSFYWPAVGTGQSVIAADSSPSSYQVHSAPRIPKATTLTPSYTNSTAAGTVDAYVGYDPQ